MPEGPTTRLVVWLVFLKHIMGRIWIDWIYNWGFIRVFIPNSEQLGWKGMTWIIHWTCDYHVGFTEIEYPKNYPLDNYHCPCFLHDHSEGNFTALPWLQFLRPAISSGQVPESISRRWVLGQEYMGFFTRLCFWHLDSTRNYVSLAGNVRVLRFYQQQKRIQASEIGYLWGFVVSKYLSIGSIKGEKKYHNGNINPIYTLRIIDLKLNMSLIS